MKNTKYKLLQFSIAPLIIVIFAFFAHGILLISDFTIYDGWEIEEWTIRQNWDIMLKAHAGGGIPLLAYYRGIFMFFPNPNYAYKVHSFLCFLISSLFIYSLCRKIGKIKKTEALFIALISLTFPAFKVGGESSVAQYLFCYCIFLGASVLAVISKDTNGWKSILLRVASLFIFFYSFLTGSLLVFYFGFILSMIIYDSKITVKNSFNSMPKWLLYHIDYLMLPFIYWAVARVLTPPNKFYADYNIPSFSPGRIFYGYINFCFNFLPNSIMDIFRIFPVLYLLIFIIMFFPFFFMLKKEKCLIMNLNPENKQSLKLLLFGTVLIFLATFPYIAVGKPCRVLGWNSRNALLVSLPLGIIFLSLLRFLYQFFISVYLEKRIPLSLVFSIAIVSLIAFSIRFNKAYIHWQALAVKERSVFHNFKQFDNYSQYTIIEIKNNYTVPETIPYYPTVMWTYQFRRFTPEWNPLVFQISVGLKSFGGNSIGPRNYTQHELNELIDATTIGYALQDTDTYGRQGILTIFRGKHYSVMELATKYWWYKYFQPEEMDDFLSSVTRINFGSRCIVTHYEK